VEVYHVAPHILNVWVRCRWVVSFTGCFASAFSLHSLRHWGWRQHVPLKFWYPSTILNGVSTQKATIWTLNWEYKYTSIRQNAIAVVLYVISANNNSLILYNWSQFQHSMGVIVRPLDEVKTEVSLIIHIYCNKFAQSSNCWFATALCYQVTAE
jgi:hypothetical protein